MDKRVAGRFKTWLRVVAGVEVASANTQTSKSPDVSPLSAGTAALPTQFVVGMGKCFLLLYCVLRLTEPPTLVRNGEMSSSLPSVGYRVKA